MGDEKVVGVAVSLIHLLLEAPELGLGLVQLPQGNVNGGEGGMEIPIGLEARRRGGAGLGNNAVEGVGVVQEGVAAGEHGVGVAVGGDGVGGEHVAEEGGDLVGLGEGEVEGHELVVRERGGEEAEAAHAGEEGEGLRLHAAMDEGCEHGAVGLGVRGQGGEVALGLPGGGAGSPGEEVEADGVGAGG